MPMSDRRLFRAAYMMHPYWIGSPIKPGEWINTTDKVLWWMHNLDADTDMGDTPLDDLEKYLCLEEILPILSGQYAATAAFKTANDWGSVKPWFINFVAVIRHDVPDLNSLQVWIPNSLAAGGLATSMSCCANAA
nr:hypothetical protein [Mycobacteroides chelonae]